MQFTEYKNAEIYILGSTINSSEMMVCKASHSDRRGRNNQFQGGSWVKSGSPSWGHLCANLKATLRHTLSDKPGKRNTL